MSRPALPPLKRGDELIMISTAQRFRSEGARVDMVRVVTVGSKYVHVVLAPEFDDLNPQRNTRARKFLIADQQEGAPESRVGYPVMVLTAEQYTYRQISEQALAYLSEQGIRLDYVSPWRGREVELAAALKAAVDA